MNDENMKIHVCKTDYINVSPSEHASTGSQHVPFYGEN